MPTFGLVQTLGGHRLGADETLGAANLERVCWLGTGMLEQRWLMALGLQIGCDAMPIMPMSTMEIFFIQSPVRWACGARQPLVLGLRNCSSRLS